MGSSEQESRDAQVRQRPYDRVTHQGFTVNRRTLNALQWAEKDAGFRFLLAQGSYNRGGVGASAGTHDGGGVVDLRTVILSEDERKQMVKSLRRAGFAAWFRPAVAGLWGQHVHAVLLGDKEASSQAQQQMQAYIDGRNGLAGNGPDTGWRPKELRWWSFGEGRPVTVPGVR